MNKNLNEYIRQFGFKIYQTAKKGRVFNHISEHKEVQSLDRDSLMDYQKKKLIQLLLYCKTNVPFYKSISLSDDLGNISELLSNLPVVNKSRIRENYDSFFSTLFHKNELHKVKTSGSSGEPFIFYKDAKKKERELAATYYFGNWTGLDIGVKHGRVQISKQSALTPFLMNQFTFDPKLMDTTGISDVCKYIVNKKIRHLRGYTTSIYQIAQYLANNYSRNEIGFFESIICLGEPLYQDQRNTMSSVFNCPIISRYSANEIGIIGYECPERYNMHLNYGDLIIEHLKLDSNDQAEPGEKARIVITDLHNYAMPLIRYDIGDIGIYSFEVCNCGRNLPVLNELSGRQITEIITPDGRVISGNAVVGVFEGIEEIKEFQFIQKDLHEYMVKLVLKDSLEEGLKNYLTSSIENVIGPTVNIEFKECRKIDKAQSGKYFQVLSELSLIR
jgi:phenylacetate-CoA ligase